MSPAAEELQEQSNQYIRNLTAMHEFGLTPAVQPAAVLLSHMAIVEMSKNDPNFTKEEMDLVEECLAGLREAYQNRGDPSKLS